MKGAIEDEMIRQQIASLTQGHEFEQTSGDSGGQRNLVCCSPWGHKELDSKEDRMPKNRRFQTLVLEKTPESPLDSKDIRPVHLKGNQP